MLHWIKNKNIPINFPIPIIHCTITDHFLCIWKKCSCAILKLVFVNTNSLCFYIYRVVLLGPLMVNSRSKAWAAYVCCTVLWACRWLIRRGTACSSCSLGSWRERIEKKLSNVFMEPFDIFKYCRESSYLASEDHDILDGIRLEHWELINYNDNKCVEVINV